MTERRSPESRYSYRHQSQADLVSAVLIIAGWLLAVGGMTCGLAQDFRLGFWLLMVGVFTHISGRWVMGIVEENDRHRRRENGFVPTTRQPWQTVGGRRG